MVGITIVPPICVFVVGRQTTISESGCCFYSLWAWKGVSGREGNFRLSEVFKTGWRWRHPTNVISPDTTLYPCLFQDPPPSFYPRSLEAVPFITSTGAYHQAISLPLFIQNRTVSRFPSIFLIEKVSTSMDWSLLNVGPVLVKPIRLLMQNPRTCVLLNILFIGFLFFNGGTGNRN